ncbi:MAG: translation initiation factor IF-2 subunit beta [Candidatus Micrarchaeaceae archaeon]
MDYNELLERAFSKLPSTYNQHYDFEIPSADCLQQGNKTIIKNAYHIADIARRSMEEIAKFLTKEFAAPVNSDRQSLIINAKIAQQTVNEKIKKFFELYVICKECHKPDTKEIETERGYITLLCEACGARYTIKGL